MRSDYKAGFVIDGETSTNHEYPGEPDTWHACEDEKCICGKSHIRFGPLSANVTFLDNWSYTLAHTDPSDLDPFMHYYVSDTFGDKNMRGQCPHKGYKINAEVVDTDGDPLPKATVSTRMCRRTSIPLPPGRRVTTERPPSMRRRETTR